MRQSIESRLDERATRAPAPATSDVRGGTEERRFQIRLRPTFVRRPRTRVLVA